MAQPEHSSAHGVFHLPPPSIWPPVLAVGIALILTGLVLNIVMLAAGVIISVVSIAAWVRGARREYRNLPQQ